MTNFYRLSALAIALGVATSALGQTEPSVSLLEESSAPLSFRLMVLDRNPEARIAPAVSSGVSTSADDCAGPAFPIERTSISGGTAAARRTFWWLVRSAECHYAIPTGLLDSIILQESHYSPLAVSRAGAAGLAQLMPSTARAMGVANRFDPRGSIEGGARYLRQMLDRFGSVPLAVAAYNAGPSAVERAKGIPLNHETPNYVQRVMAYLAEHVSATQVALRRASLSGF